MDLSWIRGLDGPDLPRPCCTPATVAEARRWLGDGPVRWAVAAGQAMTRHIIDHVPEHGVGPAPFETLRRASEAAVLTGLCVLAAQGPVPYGVPPDGVEVVRDCVRRGIPLDRVLRGLRLGHAVLYRMLRDSAPDGDLPTEITEELFEQVDRMAGDMAAAYVAERERWEASQEAVRWHLIEAIIAGEQHDPDAAEQILGYRPSRCHVALIAWSAAPGGDGADRLVADLLAASGGDAWLQVVGHAGAVWAWIGFGDRPGRVEWPSVLPAGWRAAAGPPSFGLAGIRRSHLGALRAARIAATLPAGGGVCDYGEVRTAALLLENAERARWYVEETLGALAADEDRAEQLRETLRCYLSCGRSLKNTAERLGVARNTVAYRIKQAQDLMRSGSGRLEVRIALEIMRFPRALETATAPPPDDTQGPKRRMYVKPGLAP
ncbi:PucR family transcriptional regulator [Actinomadura sp. GTD37]|uniref:PucR family transcriptional regulator n=1 Tax=Actinomadura sp. GTD37 TaxID=1778030 RepID=UPI0035BF9738